MKPSKISLSLIVPTIGRERDIVRLLDSLCAQTSKDFETIVVDQSKHPNYIDAILAKYDEFLNIKHVVHKERGAAKARNEGVLHATGGILGWPDDDCWYESQVVEKVLELFSSKPISVLLGTPLTEDGQLYNRRVPKSDKKVGVQEILNFGIEWSIFVRKDIFLKVTGYDQRIGPGAGTIWAAGESSDLCLQIISHDKNIRYSPAIRIHHPQSRATTSDAAQKAYRYAYGMGALCKKNNLSTKDLSQYFWGYLRALGWALIRIKPVDVHYHFLRIKGLTQGYRNYYRDSKSLAGSGNA